MNNAVLIQQSSGSHNEMLEIAMPHHTAYCKRHKIDYRPFLDYRFCKDRNEVWEKVLLMRDACCRGYEYVIWLDSDCLIVGEEDLRNGCPKDPRGALGMCWHSMEWGKIAPMAYDHYNCGAIYIHNSAAVREFLEQWLKWPEHEHGWKEQHSLNEMAKLNPRMVQRISNRWNSTPPYFEYDAGKAARGKQEVVRAWHGLFDGARRAQVMQTALDNLGAGGNGHESGLWKSLIRSEELMREEVYDMRRCKRQSEQSDEVEAEEQEPVPA